MQKQLSHIAFIALGSNLQNPLEQCRQALRKIENTEGIHLVRCSSFYNTEPLVAEGGDPQRVPKYVNAVCEIQTTLNPEDLLSRLLTIEKEMGRELRPKWESRLIDLDLLFYEDWVVSNSQLRIPHPEIQNRRFVLEPLCEIAPKWIHPVLQKTIEELAKIWA